MEGEEGRSDSNMDNTEFEKVSNQINPVNYIGTISNDKAKSLNCKEKGNKINTWNLYFERRKICYTRR